MSKMPTNRMFKYVCAEMSTCPNSECKHRKPGYSNKSFRCPTADKTVVMKGVQQTIPVAKLTRDQLKRVIVNLKTELAKIELDRQLAKESMVILAQTASCVTKERGELEGSVKALMSQNHNLNTKLQSTEQTKQMYSNRVSDLESLVTKLTEERLDADR